MASSLDCLQQTPPAGTSIDVAWRSFELRPRNAPPISPEKRAQIEAARPRVYAVAREQYGLTMNPGPFGFDSRPALIGAKFAEAQGKGPAYHKRVMNAYWQEAQPIDDLDVLTDLAVEVGLDRNGFRAALEDAAFEQQVEHDIAQARAYGVGGVPAMVFADTFLVSGAQPYDALFQATEQVAAHLSSSEK